MSWRATSITLGQESKNMIIGTFLVANAFVWYFAAFSFLQRNFQGNSLLLVIFVNIAFLILTALLVTLIGKFKRRLAFLKYWILAGVVFSLAYLFLDLANFWTCMVASGVLGVYFGLGMPTCMGYFAVTTSPQRRAKWGAIIILSVGLGFPILSIIGGSQNLPISSVLTLWRILPLIILAFFKPPEIVAEPKNTVSYRTVLGNKTFLLYLVPWLMFALINDLTMQLNNQSFSNLPQVFTGNYLIIENVLSGISAVACGFLADRKGRKRVALIGFVLLGLGYAVLGLSNVSYFAAWFYICVDGIAWGAFAMLFIVTLWGDIAEEKNSEKYYFLGVLPYLLSNFTGLLLGPLVSGRIGESTVFSFASFFLFIAVLPLAYAPETLPEKIIKNLDINSYIRKAQEKASENKK